jgi:hypothetical protein
VGGGLFRHGARVLEVRAAQLHQREFVIPLDDPLEPAAVVLLMASR